jgi:hypothetical protein
VPVHVAPDLVRQIFQRPEGSPETGLREHHRRHEEGGAYTGGGQPSGGIVDIPRRIAFVEVDRDCCDRPWAAFPRGATPDCSEGQAFM